MTDSFIITCDNGQQLFLNRQACFAPMRRLTGWAEFQKGIGKGFFNKHKVSSVTYYVGIHDHALMSQYAKMMMDIKSFKKIIMNLNSDSASGSCVMTLNLNNPNDAVLYTLGAMRYIKERQADQDMIKKILDAGIARKDAGLAYLLMEGIQFDGKNFRSLGDRGHANSDCNLTVGNALAFNDGTLQFGTMKPYSDTLSYQPSWGCTLSHGKLVGSKSNFFGVFLAGANKGNGDLSIRIRNGIDAVKKKGGVEVATVSAPQSYGINPCAQPAVFDQHIRRGAQMAQVHREAVVDDAEVTVRIGKMDIPVNQQTWIERLNPKRWLHATNRAKFYNTGYKVGFRLRNKK